MSDASKEESEQDKITALNTLILNYYKKIGRKKDLEKYFSLSTVEGEARDPSSVFWRKLKMQNDSSDSGGRTDGSSKELCCISIKCTVPEPSSSQDEDRKSESHSPPIITENEEVPVAAPQSDEESIKSDDLHKSMDATHDMSSNKPVSPTSSINSQRKLEWDSLADVGYTNESDKKTSASSYSTLERLAFKPHYIDAHNESKDAELGNPNAHSTLAEVHAVPSSKKKGHKKKRIELKNRDIDTVEFNVPQSSANVPPINLNLTKHISFNMDKSGEVTVEKTKPDTVFTIPAKVQTVSVETVTTPVSKVDKEIQTSLIKSADDDKVSQMSLKAASSTVPYYVSLKSLKKRLHKKRSKVSKKSNKRKTEAKEELCHEKSGEPVSEAESFEYMPGHIYNQNQLKVNLQKSRNSAGNKSSLESSAGITTESSKTSNGSFTNDLDKSVEKIQIMLQHAQNDPKLKKKLVKQLVQRLLSTKYKNDKSTSALTTSSQIIDDRFRHKHSTTTSNSDANYSDQPLSSNRPRKSILRVNRFDQNSMAGSSQSVPNLPLAAVASRGSPRRAPIKKPVITTSHTESDMSSKGRESDKSVSDLSITELCQKYLETVKKEDMYKRYLGEKEKLIKQKLAKAQSKKSEPQLSEKFNKIKELMNDLVRNNYDDGSGDASNIEARSPSYDAGDNGPPRSHSLFTLSSGNINRGDRGSLRSRIEHEIVGQCLRQGCPNADRHQIQCYPYHSEYCGTINNPCRTHFDNNRQLVSPTEPVLVRTTRGMPENAMPPCPPSNCPPVNCPPVKCPPVNCSPVKCPPVNCPPVNCPPVNYPPVKCAPDKYPPGKSPPDKNPPGPSQPQPTFVCVSFPPKRKERRFSEMIQPADNYFSFSYDRSERKGSRSGSASPRGTASPRGSASPRRESSVIKPSPKKDTRRKLVEHTKKIQTEISINPKISDPSLSDISVIKVDYCVEENRNERDIPNTPSGSFSINLREISLADKNTGSFVFGGDQIDVGVQSNADDNRNDDIFAKNDSQGFVFQSCIDVEIQKDVDDVKKSNSKGTVSISENPISLIEECTRSFRLDIECKCNDGKSQERLDEVDCDCEMATQHLPIVDEEEPVPIDEPPHLPPTKYNTYPLTEKKSVTRSFTADSIHDKVCDTAKTDNLVDCQTNTEIDKMSCMGDVQVESQSEKSNAGTPRSRKSSTKIDSLSSKCSTLEIIKDITRRYDKKDIGKLKRKSCFKEIMNVLTYLLDTEDSSDGGNNSKPSDCDPECVKYDEARKSVPSENKNKLLDCDPECIKYKNDRKSDSLQPSQSSMKKKSSVASGAGASRQSVAGASRQSVARESLASALSSPRHAARQSEQYQPKTQSITSRQSMSRKSEASAQTLREPQAFQSRQSKISTGSQESNYSSQRQYTIAECVRPSVQSQTSKIVAESMCSVYTQAGPIKELVDQKVSVCSNTSPRAALRRSESVQVPRSPSNSMERKISVSTHTSPRGLVDKGVQRSNKKTPKMYVQDSSDFPDSSDMQTSTDSATCKILDRIKKECERYHNQRKCKCSSHKKREVSSSTSVNCEQCREEYRHRHSKCHKCTCDFHRAKAEKCRKKSSGMAYNLVIQTTDSVASIDRREERPENKGKSLKNIVVKVPRKAKGPDYVPFKETATKISDFQCTRQSPEPQFYKSYRSKSLPEDSDAGPPHCYTVKDYLEKNRPDFIENAESRQNCLKVINESRSPPNQVPMRMIVFHAPPKCCPNAACQRARDCYPGVTMHCRGPCDEPGEITRIANERAIHRELLLLQLERSASLNDVSGTDVRHLARAMGVHTRRREPPPKFTSERAMKKHSEKIYKSLPEVVQKKEDIKKEKIKKTNLLMANIFKKNLQRKTLRGNINLSNYSTVIKI